MNWYYAKDGGQFGPIDQTELDRLAQQGEINSNTLVWREGMANWQAYDEIGGPPRISPAMGGGGIRCVECGKFFAQEEVIRLGPGYVCGTCKPIVMQKIGEGVMASGSEQIRNEHIKHEASVKSIGFLYFLGGCALILIGVASTIGGRASSLLIGLVLLAFGVGQLVVAVGLRKLKSWARIPTGIFAGIGLLGFPLGTLINGYILYLIFCKKGATVFSKEYQQVIAETPHIKYRTSIVVWIFLGLLLFLVIFGLFGFALSSRR